MDREIEDVIISAIIAAIIFSVFVLAASVGEKRADAMKECYKAAQVNHNIKCEAEK